MEPLSHGELTRILSGTRKKSENYIQTMADFLGVSVEELCAPLPPRSRRRKLYIRYENYKDRVDRAWQILRKGYYDGENDW